MFRKPDTALYTQFVKQPLGLSSQFMKHHEHMHHGDMMRMKPLGSDDEKEKEKPHLLEKGRRH